jgi:hypothetical protein
MTDAHGNWRKLLSMTRYARPKFKLEARDAAAAGGFGGAEAEVRAGGGARITCGAFSQQVVFQQVEQTQL